MVEKVTVHWKGEVYLLCFLLLFFSEEKLKNLTEWLFYVKYINTTLCR